MLAQAARRETLAAGKYSVTLVLDEKGEPIGAIVEGPRLPHPVYIARGERVTVKLPKQVKKLLKKHGFQLE